LREISEPAVYRPQRSLTFGLAMLGALALALPLAGCGRKGPLDPPPGGYALDRGTTRTAVSKKGEAPGATEPAQKDGPTYDESGAPIAPAGQRKRLPADWLLD
jgi:predicted small lipoprotein YifL